MLPDLGRNISADLRIVLQILLGILAPLPDLASLIGIPGSALVNHVNACRKIQHIPHIGNALAEHNVKLRLLKGRGYLVFHDLHPGPVADYFPALL